jgi:hypothetical protein
VVGKRAIAGDERRLDLLRLIAQAQALERMERPAAGLRPGDPPRRTVTAHGRRACSAVAAVGSGGPA